MTLSKKKIVGYVHSGYPEKRNFYGLELENFEYRKHVLDPFKIADYAYYKTLNKTNYFLHNSNLGKGNYDIFHLFNGISFGKKPWISTFETIIPRFPVNYNQQIKKGIKALANSNCKQIIALSENAKKNQLKFLEDNFLEYKKEIEKKIKIIHPSQKKIISDYSDKKLNKEITFTIVGADFFRKGGKEIVEVFDSLLSEKYEVKLNIVSSMNFGDYASQTNEEDLNRAVKTIDKYPDSISHYSYLDNKQVLDLLKSTHVAMLPSYADTYGYFVLEAQACGCPVITTDIRAFPEINNHEVGYIIPVPKNELGYGIISNKEERVLFSSILKEKLNAIINHIYNNPKETATKGKACLNRISEYHNPADVSEVMNQIYLNSTAS